MIKQLQLELEKSKNFKSMRGENLDPNTRHRKANTQLNASSFLQQRKKERNMEEKIKELEGVIADDRKHMARLQHLNTQLLGKIKGVTNSEKMNQVENNTYARGVKSLKQENYNLKQDK